MYSCDSCKPPFRSPTDHANDSRPPEQWSCNWLDWMIEENNGVCLHCGGPVTHFEPAPLGKMMDALRFVAED